MLFTDLSSERIVRALRKAGFRIVSQGKPIGMSDEKNPYTLKAILKSAGLTDEQFRDLL